ncbi:Sua5/YciO/YrdC/YwlC family protein [Kushneria aurantia]|uniref:Threonylcarbamoyl-AMP synthase n=1 Tax=Kushneria aurantia TaxID=504092 RepID=A0ABV6G7Z3_9GAMM|nr:Sua5/YciO/YrdC/YwlC family protein [Kushneria aurantia]
MSSTRLSPSCFPSSPSPDEPALQAAVAALRAEGVLAYPTEAVWGLGCDPDSDRALRRLIALKQRAAHKGLILVGATLAQFDDYLTGLDAGLRARLGESRPAPVSWLVPDNGRAHPLVRGEHTSVALRISQHPLVAALCHAFGGPLVSSSANIAAESPCMSADEIRERFGADLALLDGPLGGFERPSEIRDLLSGRVIRR